MKKIIRTNIDGDILPEYIFKGGKRGMHFKEYRKGHTVKIEQQDGSIITHFYSEKEGSITLEPEVKKYFPDSKSVNNALKTIIKLFPKKTNIMALKNNK